MRIKISHNTSYQFDSEVFLEPHYLRFHPKKTAYSDVINFNLQIEPQPAGNKEVIDAESNQVNFCWFEGMADRLDIQLETIIETHDYNPFAFIIAPFEYNELPFSYQNKESQLLQPYLGHQDIGKDLENYTKEILQLAKRQTIPFLTQFTQKIHEDFEVVYREEGAPLPINECFQSKEGSCRDLAWMQINAFRKLGIAARFASGYYYFMMEEPSYELHAWTEVFLPGAGWVGLDPSHGILCGNTHIPIVSSAFPENTMPVTGSIRGSAQMELKTELIISIL